jgi:2'-5'-oligoadenylate synthetase/2'-5'-oligoadenylate synthase-like protein
MSMNIQVSVKTMEKGAATAKVEMTVTPAETVRSVKEKVAAAQLIAFPEHKLVCGGEKLDEKKTLGDCGVTEASAVEFVLEATEDSVVTQLKELLKSRDLTCDELGLLYCYKHGVSTNQALKTIGIEMKLADFIKDRKEFVLEGGKISMVRDDTSLKPLSVADQLEQILKENGPTMEVTALCSKFIQKFHVSVANVVQMRPLDFIMKEKTKFALVGNNMVTLKEFEKQEKAKQEKAKVEGSALRMARSRSPQTSRAPPPAPWKQQEAPKRRSPSPPRRPATQQIEQNEDLYQELHTKISSRSFNSRVAQALSSIKEIVEQHCFLNVVDVVKGGSVGKGTAITDCEDAELVFFVKGLPTEGHQKWMAPLLRSVKATLSLNFPSDLLASMDCTDDSVRMDVKGGLVVNVRFSPAFENYVETVQALGMLGPYARKPFEPSFVKERTQFVAKQPGHVKVTMRLMKWWRDQQAWSCPLTTPSDYVLELIVIYAAQQCGKVAQAQMIANCMSLLARFDQLRVVWSNYYDPSDVWSPLMLQKPLLMDPVNPFTNVADPQDFDARELMSFASSTHFFW